MYKNIQCYKNLILKENRMFAKIIEKVNTFADHHQFFFALVVGLCVVCISWCIEQILDRYVFAQKKLLGYVVAIVVALILLWAIKHFVLHVI